MKNFYEMWQILEGTDYDAWLEKPYQDAEEHWSRVSNFQKVLGEDEEDPFSLEVDVTDGHWESTGSIWVKDYLPNGSENPASEPEAIHAGGRYGHKHNGTLFKKPGKRLELLPASIRAEAIKWIDKEVDYRIANPPEPEDPRDWYDDDR